MPDCMIDDGLGSREVMPSTAYTVAHCVYVVCVFPHSMCKCVVCAWLICSTNEQIETQADYPRFIAPTHLLFVVFCIFWCLQHCSVHNPYLLWVWGLGSKLSVLHKMKTIRIMKLLHISLVCFCVLHKIQVPNFRTTEGR